MTLRPQINNKPRPLSAIYVGPNPLPSTSHLPDLPEPPSPGASSNGSGLPSPPATNSTGSGSTGDNTRTDIDTGFIRQRLSASTMQHNAYGKQSHASTPSRNHRTLSELDEDDERDDDDYDEDDTARLVRRQSARVSNDNALALQRVKSLTQRNLAAIGKLSRLGTPSPTGVRTSRSPAPPSAPSSSSSSNSTASSRHSHTRSFSLVSASAPHEEPLQSGSETERENNGLSTFASHDDSDVNSTPSTSLRVSKVVDRPPIPEFSNQSNTAHDRLSSRLSGPNNSIEDGRISRGIIRGGTPALRKSPEPRRSFPRSNNGRSSLDRKSPPEPATPSRDRSSSPFQSRNTRSPQASTSSNAQGHFNTSPRRNRLPPTRDSPRRHQNRWMSEDLSSSFSGSERVLSDDRNVQMTGGKPARHRGGSAESPLVALNNGGRSLVGEGLRAAGIVRRDSNDDVFDQAPGTSRSRSSLAQGSTDRAGEMQQGSRGHGRSNSTVAEPSSQRTSEGIGPSSRIRTEHYADNTTVSNGSSASAVSDQREDRYMHRPVSSLDRVRDEGPRSAHPTVRHFRSMYAFPEREHGASSSTGFYSRDDRSAPSPFERRPASTVLQPAALKSAQLATEHNRLMFDALSVFETHLSRLPAMGNLSTNTVPELVRSAQSIAHASEKLNTQLRVGTNRALDGQIDAEVNDADLPINLAEIWRQVGAECRESLRVSDELVRSMTDFLLGVSKIVREATSSSGISSDGGRDPSVGNDSTNHSAMDGRRSVVSSRQSWEPTLKERESLRQISNRAEVRSPIPRAAPALKTFGELEHRESPALEARHSNSTDLLGTRRVVSREYQDSDITNGSSSSRSGSIRPLTSGGMVSSNSQESAAYEYEPSPTPAPRHATTITRSRTLHVSVPPPLSTLPSESLIRLHEDSPIDSALARRRPGVSPIVAPRQINPLPAISSPNATTAITTHTVSNSPSASLFPLTRQASTSSSHLSQVTFSKPSTVSALSGLQLQQQRDARKRTISSTSASDVPVSSHRLAGSSLATNAPPSGSESEREGRRRTMGARSGRASLDTSGPPERSAAPSYTGSTSSTARRERRPMVTEIFPR